MSEIKVIDPKVTLLGYGPEKVLKRELTAEVKRTKAGNVILPKEFIQDGKILIPESELSIHNSINPDEIGQLASLITYKDTGVMGELMEQMMEQDFTEKVTAGLIASAGAGHASIATNPGLWVYLEGNTSKFVDSLFTGARFMSALMPSGRRIPIEKEQILVPESIADMGGEALDLYLNTSRSNIQAHETLKANGVPKQVASKIVQYGLRGGGEAFFPLETIINLKIRADADKESIPKEGLEILSELEKIIHGRGMGITYEARKAAARTGCPNPELFHSRTNHAHEIMEENEKNALYEPALLSLTSTPTKDLERRVKAYLERREELFREPGDIRRGWRNILKELDNIIHDHNTEFDAVTATNTPWRVWGEVKRHRTMPQTVESIYDALERANKMLSSGLLDFGMLKSISSVPASVESDEDNFKLWRDRIYESVRTYNALIEMGIPKSDAIAVVPRGMKVGVTKKWDLYNLTSGYASLRLCNHAEPEMQDLTEREMKLITGSPDFPDHMAGLVVPKCGYIGFCPDKTHCSKIIPFDPTYDKKKHKELMKERADQIRVNLRD